MRMQSIMRQGLAGFRPAPDVAALQGTNFTVVAADTGHHKTRIVTGVLIGAVAGSAILGGIELHHAAHADDGFFQAQAAAVAFAGGAVVGGLLGWLIAAASE